MDERFKKAPEIKEELPKHEIAFAFIKPDFFNDLPEIEKILTENGLEVIYRDKIKLSKYTIGHIYNDVKDQHFYPALEKYLTTHEVIVLLVGGKGHKAQEVLSSLKKNNGKNGVIRERFQKDAALSDDVLKKWQLGGASRSEEGYPEDKQEELSVVLTQRNVIHTADSTKEALDSLELILGPKFKEMEAKGNLPAELWDLFSKD